jgi:uncharacterized protein
MIRVVLDTNIILSSLLQPLGPPAKVMYLARRGLLQLCMSGPIYAEYEEVIQRPRFSRISAAIGPTLQFVRESGLWVRPAESLKVCKDPDDDIFVECAEKADASWLVTGNVQDFPPEWRGTQIVTPRHFLDRLISETQVE